MKCLFINAIKIKVKVFFQFIVLCFCIAAALARPEEHEPIPILKHDFVQHETGEYTLDVETGDGVVINQAGHLKQGRVLNEKGEEEVANIVVMTGSFSYIGDDGKHYTVRYVADENGFQPEAEHLPVA